MREPRLSVIVPVYNTEKYLEQCIDSLLSQDFNNYEIILIDDGSFDKSPEICDRYAELNNKISVVHQSNKGVSSARNRGLQMAKGIYVTFVDSDDFISPQMYQHLIRKLENNKADLACCDVDYYDESGKKVKGNKKNIDSVMTGYEFSAHIFDRPRTVTGSMCNKVFFREKIVGFFDESIASCEDILFLIKYCTRCKKIVYVNEAYYHIRERENSLSRSGNDYLDQGLGVREKIISLMKPIDSNLRELAESDFLDACLLYGNSENLQLKRYVKANIVSILRNSKIKFRLKWAYILKTFMR